MYIMITIIKLCKLYMNMPVYNMFMYHTEVVTTNHLKHASCSLIIVKKNTLFTINRPIIYDLNTAVLCGQLTWW